MYVCGCVRGAQACFYAGISAAFLSVCLSFRSSARKVESAPPSPLAYCIEEAWLALPSVLEWSGVWPEGEAADLVLLGLGLGQAMRARLWDGGCRSLPD